MNRKLIRLAILFLLTILILTLVACNPAPPSGGTGDGGGNGNESGGGTEDGGSEGGEPDDDPAHEHSFEGEWTKTLAPTAEAEGEETNVCTSCGKTVKRTIEKLTVVALKVTTPPDQTVYYTNEKFKPRGMVVTATFGDGSSSAVSNYVIETAEGLTAKDRSVIISYYGQKASVEVSVSPVLYDIRRDYVVELAYAFLNQSDNIDFDGLNSRRHVHPSPEDATEFNKIYLDTVSFVDSVYFNAFGVGVLPSETSDQGETLETYILYAKNNPNNPDVVGYWEAVNYPTDQEKSTRIASIRKILEIGDVLVVRNGNKTPTSGIAYIYIGNNQFMCCTGAKKDAYVHNGTNPEEAYDSLKDNPIIIEKASNIFDNKNSSRYIFSERAGNKVFDFAVIRPISRDLSTTRQADGRMTMPSVSIEKSVDVGPYTAVFTGDTLTYTVTLSNKSEYEIKNVVFTDILSKHVELVKASDNLTVDGNKLSWSGRISSFATVTLRYIVKVTSTEAGSIIRSDRGEVNEVKLNSIINTVSGISDDKINEIVTKAKSYAEAGTEFSDPILAVKAIYREVLGVELFDYETVAAALEDLIDFRSNSYNPSSENFGMMIPDLCGGYSIKDGNAKDNNRVRLLTKEYLSKGDVILTEYTNADGVNCSVVYISLGGRNCLAISSADGICKQVSISNSVAKNILVSLYSHNKYVILRPSMALTSE